MLQNACIYGKILDVEKYTHSVYYSGAVKSALFAVSDNKIKTEWRIKTGGAKKWEQYQ